MVHSLKSIVMCCAVAAAGWTTGCVTADSDTAQADESQPVAGPRSHGGTEIHPEDDCDPTTFGALCNSNFHGGTTLAAFQAELAATQRVAAWEYGGGQGSVNGGTALRVDNKGGETHTFTVVANFGGGRDAAINAASGNTVVAPECVAGPNPLNVDIPSLTGANVTTGPNGALKPGSYKVQCCIHPWMHSTVVVH
jgi:hypothetical protein